MHRTLYCTKLREQISPGKIAHDQLQVFKCFTLKSCHNYQLILISLNMKWFVDIQDTALIFMFFCRPVGVFFQTIQIFQAKASNTYKTYLVIKNCF